ncbi:chromate transporter [Spirochaeta thermophila]|uniref:Transporter n=1 Tax=Winmispira thermophila (strain ATCC 49972 / DSM 6192 / RI 19.B1) TaxID=665571 RepID=E0RQM8_WINT6|nr:chromate transporter [Spirochaeta thermophila]ADN01532.1 transporter [Spirochaeta thermophila DSM 6192]
MSEVWGLFVSFFKIGAFAFGGGYAMIPLIASEVEGHGWLSARVFADVVAIAEMTPGPVAINMATFVGFRVAGVPGALVATVGVVLPSFLLVLVVGRWLARWEKAPLKEAVFSGLRPAVVGLIGSAVWVVGRGALLDHPPEALRIPLGPGVDGISLLIAAAAFLVFRTLRLHPVWVILGGAAAGMLVGLMVPGWGG